MPAALTSHALYTSYVLEYRMSAKSQSTLTWHNANSHLSQCQYAKQWLARHWVLLFCPETLAWLGRCCGRFYQRDSPVKQQLEG